MVDVNFRATAVLTRLVAERMAARRRGHIVTVASFAGVVGIPGAAVYSATKAADRIFTASLRQELGERGVTLTDVVLGSITTGMLEEVESNPRVRRYFDRFRRLGLLTDTSAPRVGAAIVGAIRREEAVVVLPSRGRYLVLPAQGLARQIGAWLAR
jgi:short-subunit dehydrogenase